MPPIGNSIEARLVSWTDYYGAGGILESVCDRGFTLNPSMEALEATCSGVSPAALFGEVRPGMQSWTASFDYWLKGPPANVIGPTIGNRTNAICEHVDSTPNEQYINIFRAWGITINWNVNDITPGGNDGTTQNRYMQYAAGHAPPATGQIEMLADDSLTPSFVEPLQPLPLPGSKYARLSLYTFWNNQNSNPPDAELDGTFVDCAALDTKCVITGATVARLPLGDAPIDVHTFSTSGPISQIVAGAGAGYNIFPGSTGGLVLPGGPVADRPPPTTAITFSDGTYDYTGQAFMSSITIGASPSGLIGGTVTVQGSGQLAAAVTS